MAGIFHAAQVPAMGRRRTFTTSPGGHLFRRAPAGCARIAACSASSRPRSPRPTGRSACSPACARCAATCSTSFPTSPTPSRSSPAPPARPAGTWCRGRGRCANLSRQRRQLPEIRDDAPHAAPCGRREPVHVRGRALALAAPRCRAGFRSRNVAALAPVMTRTAERAASASPKPAADRKWSSEMLSATFDVICEVALSGREHFDANVYGPRSSGIS